jgi:hypothetical protein
MSNTVPLSSAAKTQAAGLFVAGIGVLIQYLVGVPGFPKVPPGPIILIVAAILVWTVTPRFRWIVILGLLASLFITVGGLGAGGFSRVGNPGDFGPWVGTALQLVGLIVALIWGVVALVQAFQGAGQKVTS